MTPASFTPPRRLVLLGLTLTLGLTLGLRWVGIGHLLPHKNEPDGQIVHLSQDHPDGPFRGKYPFLPIVLNDLVTGSAGDALSAGDPLEEHLVQAAQPFVRARKFLTLLAWLLVPGSFFLGRRFFSPAWSVFSAAMVGVCPLLLCYGTQARPHALVAAAGVGATLACLHLARRGSFKNHVLAAISTAACVSCMHTGFAALAPYTVALIILWRRSGHLQLVRALAGLAAIAVMATWAYWPAEVDPLREGGRGADVMDELGMDEAWRGAGVRGSMRLRDPSSRANQASAVADERLSIEVAGHRIFLDYFNGGGLVTFLRALKSYNPVLLVLGIVGLVLALCRWRGKNRLSNSSDLLVVCSHALPLVLVLGVYMGSKERFFLPVIPYLALLATVGTRALVHWIHRLLGGRLSSRILTGVIAAGALALPLISSARLAFLRTQPDTYTLASHWLAGEATPATSTVSFANLTDIPVRQGNLYGTWARRAAVSWRNYQRRVWPPGTPGQAYKLHYPNKKNMFAVLTAPDPAKEYDQLLSQWNPDFVLIAPRGVNMEAYVDSTLPAIARETVLARGGKLVHTLSPFREKERVAMGFEYFFGVRAAQFLWQVDRLGPLVEIYSMGRNRQR